MNARLASTAELELKEVLEFYETAEPGLGARFLNEVESSIDRIVAHPLAWALLSSRTRRCRVNHFPYALFYQIRKDEILIVSVMDLRRDPKRWEQYK